MAGPASAGPEGRQVIQRFALIGAGFIGKVHAASLARHPAVSFDLVADIDKARARDTAHRYGARAIPVDSVFETDVDAVLIASSTDTHADLMDRAASAGKPSTARSPSISIWNGPSVRVGRSKERAYLS